MIERIRKKKKLVYLIILIVSLILVLIVRKTYAYLMADIGLGKTVNINSSSGSIDRLEFIPGNPLNLNISPTTLKENGSNVTSTSIPKVSLLANSTNNTASYTYLVNFKITSNFIYTVNDLTPEVMLSITNPSGALITSINGLVYKSIGDVTGFDITNKNGTFPVSLSTIINSTSATVPTIHEWTFKLTFINLMSNQSGNIGKNITTEIIIKKEEIQAPTETFAQYLVNNNATVGMDHHIASLTNGANDNNYRFSGANPNNYVCFGPGATEAGVTCPEDNIYRIIGVFNNQVKLLKKTLLPGAEVWNTASSNVWSGSTMDNLLNGTFLTNLTSVWSDKIAVNTWQVGGANYTNGTGFPATVYQYELGTNKKNITKDSKVALLYLSDYGYATTPNNWTISLSNYNTTSVKDNNWIFLGAYGWTISRIDESTDGGFSVANTGYVTGSGVNSNYGGRPVFYLLPTVNLIGGLGNNIDPYRV